MKLAYSITGLMYPGYTVINSDVLKPNLLRVQNIEQPFVSIFAQFFGPNFMV